MTLSALTNNRISNSVQVFLQYCTEISMIHTISCMDFIFKKYIDKNCNVALMTSLNSFVNDCLACRLTVYVFISRKSHEDSSMFDTT